jgi:hypothetical protein
MQNLSFSQLNIFVILDRWQSFLIIKPSGNPNKSSQQFTSNQYKAFFSKKAFLIMLLAIMGSRSIAFVQLFPQKSCKIKI